MQTYIEKVYQGIKKSIAEGKYDLHDFISEQEVADAYGVSKGTAAEALHRLCMDEELISYPRKGYVIRVINDAEHHQIQRLRFTLESLVIKILIETKSDEELQEMQRFLETRSENLSEVYYTDNTYFHMSMAGLTGDRFIVKTLQSLLGALGHTRMYFSVIKLPVESVQYHSQIILSIKMRDFPAALHWLKYDLKMDEDTISL